MNDQADKQAKQEQPPATESSNPQTGVETAASESDTPKSTSKKIAGLQDLAKLAAVATTDTKATDANATDGDATDSDAAPTTAAGAGATDQSKAEQQKLDSKLVIDTKGRNYATGRRKFASARIWIKPGKGQITVNKKDVAAYFARSVLLMVVRQPFELTERVNQYDVYATVRGGGLSGQAGAVRHGISRALAMREPELRTTIKRNGLLTRDPRTVERKKYGLRKARRSFQFSKR